MNTPILVWKFYEAPKEFQALSKHGGDEDYLAYVPDGANYNYIPWLEEGSFGVCDIHSTKVEGGTVYIGAHA